MDRYDPYTDSFIVDNSNINQFQVRTVQLVDLTDECIEKIVNKIAEVKPVVRGEWKECEIVQERGDEPIIDEWQSARCSVCGKYHTTPYMYFFDHFNYCPNCGAKMERREDG